jgi:hypothetical protein
VDRKLKAQLFQVGMLAVAAALVVAGFVWAVRR